MPPRPTKLPKTASAQNDATKGERTRTAIIDAAFDLFVRKGYHATSMRQIADEAGLAPGGLYNHFAG